MSVQLNVNGGKLSIDIANKVVVHDVMTIYEIITMGGIVSKRKYI